MVSGSEAFEEPRKRRRRRQMGFKVAALSALLVFMVIFTTLFLLTAFSVLDSRDSRKAKSAGGSSSHPADAINSAYGSFHLNMQLSRSLQGAREDPVRFMLVTGEQPNACKTSEGSHLLMLSLKNKMDYCNLHQCKVWYSLESWEPGFTGTWARYPLLKKLMLVNPSIEWFMWMDSDAIFTDMSFDIPLNTYNSWNKNLVVPGYWEKVYGDEPDWLGLNAGVFLIRNTVWSQKFLDKWMRFGLKEVRDYHTKLLNSVLKTRPKQWPADDQSALVYLLRENRTEHEQKAFLEAGYTLHGFWEAIVDKYEEFRARGNGKGASKWPFVTHFCGCKLCNGEYASSQSKRCVTAFRRAYNFADDQVIGVAGMRHLDLSSVYVEQA